MDAVFILITAGFFALLADETPEGKSIVELAHTRYSVQPKYIITEAGVGYRLVEKN